jgi:hypothetical protein
MIDIVLEQNLNSQRLIQAFSTKLNSVNVHKGLCELFEDRPTSPCLGIFTVVFAEQFCKENPGYTWRPL